MDVCKRSEESADNVLNCTDAENFAYQRAAYWIITNGNMDDLKVDDTGKCLKSDKILSWSNPSCK